MQVHTRKRRHRDTHDIQTETEIQKERARDIQAETHTTHTVTVVANGVLTDAETQRQIVTPNIETDTHTTHTVIVVTNGVLRVVIGIDPVQPGLGTHAQVTKKRRELAEISRGLGVKPTHR